MKKSGAVLVIILCSLLMISLVSASWLSDTWGKITGQELGAPEVGITGNVVTQDDCNKLTDVFRFWKPETDHFYTASVTEKNRLIDTGSSWIYQKVGFNIFNEQIEGTVPVYRFWSLQELDHAYTSSLSIKNDLDNSDLWEASGILGYVYEEREDGTLPIYRLHSSARLDNYYTTSESERSSMKQIGYRDIGITGYTFNKKNDCSSRVPTCEDECTSGQTTCGAINQEVPWDTSNEVWVCSDSDGDGCTDWSQGEKCADSGTQFCSDGECIEKQRIDGCNQLSNMVKAKVGEERANYDYYGLVTLDSESTPTKEIDRSGGKHEIALVSTSDSSATLKVTNLHTGAIEQKEISELESKEIGDLKIKVISADESNLLLSATIEVESRRSIILKEGVKIYRNEYLVVPGYFLRATSIVNQSGTTYSSDKVEFTDVLTDLTYHGVILSKGAGEVNFGAMVYNFKYGGTSNSDFNWVTLDFPQTSAEEAMTFYCDWSQRDLFDLGTLSTCSELSSFIQSPSDFEAQGYGWTLNYNYSWISEYNSRKEYYAGFSSNGGNNDYISIGVEEVDETEKQELLNQLENNIEYQLCSAQEINEQNVYICLNPWSIAYDLQNTNDIEDNNDKTIIWIRGNKLFQIYTYSYSNYDCWDQQSCAEREDYIHRRQQENLIQAFDKLQNNRPEYVGGFYLNWEAENLVSNLLSLCNSEIEIGEEVCSQGWDCIMEPIICPPHGMQKQTCTQYCNEGENVRISEMTCNPGICSGCYVPRWQWEGGLSSDNKCIPYGFRFGQENGWTIKEVYDEYSDTDGLTVEKAGTNEDDVGLEVYEDNTALLSLEITQGEYANFSLVIGETYDWNFYEGDTMENTLYVDEIYYDSTNYNKSYITVTFTSKGYYQQNVPEILNMYCDIDGKMKQQKVKDQEGTWAPCQNNYECDSNLCSSGECIELKDIAEQASGIKVFFVKLVCKLAHPISEENYNTCLYEFLGD